MERGICLSKAKQSIAAIGSGVGFRKQLKRPLTSSPASHDTIFGHKDGSALILQRSLWRAIQQESRKLVRSISMGRNLIATAISPKVNTSSQIADRQFHVALALRWRHERIHQVRHKSLNQTVKSFPETARRRTEADQGGFIQLQQATISASISINRPALRHGHHLSLARKILIDRIHKTNWQKLIKLEPRKRLGTATGIGKLVRCKILNRGQGISRRGLCVHGIHLLAKRSFKNNMLNESNRTWPQRLFEKQGSMSQDRT